jgi:hypothetical protein
LAPQKVTGKVTGPVKAAKSGPEVDKLRGKIEEVTSGYMKLFGKILPKGTVIIKKPGNTAVSEGVGFSGLILCKSGKIGADGLVLSQDNSIQSQNRYWQVYNARREYFLKSSGVMAWEVDGSGNKISEDSASDGDQDWIASEIMVLKKLESSEWKIPQVLSITGFKKQIQKDLDAFWNSHIEKVNGRLIFLSSDGSWAKRGDGRNIYYPSYPDPHFLQMFAEVDKGHDWTKLTKDVQDLNAVILDNYKKLGAIGQNPMPAKVFVSVSNGGYTAENYYIVSRNEGVTGDALKDNEADSIRFILRQARAAMLDNDVRAKEILRKLLNVAMIDGVSTVHIYAGDSKAPSKWGWNNTVARACYGVAVYAVEGEQKAKTFINSVFNDFKGDYFGEWEGAKDYYYDQSLILQVLNLIYND